MNFVFATVFLTSIFSSLLPDSRKKARTRSSTAARQAASQRQVRQRRRAQRRRRFAQQWQRIETSLAGAGALLPNLRWRSLRRPLPGFTGWHASKLLSFALLLGVIGIIYVLQQNEAFFVYRENVHFVGQTYLSEEELYQHCDVESWSVLWIDPALIRSQILEHEYVADAQIEVRWPAQVTVTVDEVEPVAMWSTQQGDYWLLADGRALPARAADGVTAPIRLVDPEAAARAPSSDGQLRVEMRLVGIAHALAEALPGLTTFWYNSSTRLNFNVPDTKTWVYWGSEQRFDEKWMALQTALPEIQSNPALEQTLNVTAPNRPFFRHFAEASTP